MEIWQNSIQLSGIRQNDNQLKDNEQKLGKKLLLLNIKEINSKMFFLI